MSRSGREVQLVAYGDGAQDPRFRVAQVPVRRPVPVRCWCAIRGPRSIRACACGCARPSLRGLLHGFALNPPARRDPDRRRGNRVTRRWIPARNRSRVACGRLARLRERCARENRRFGGLGTLARIDASKRRRRSPYLGPLGGVGLTAYVGLLHVAEAASPTTSCGSPRRPGRSESLAAQIAKLRGAPRHRQRRLARQGHAPARRTGPRRRVNHRDGRVDELLSTAAPDGIDVYFDNVGGDHLEAAVAALRRGGRVALCGAVSGYGAAAPPPGPANLFRAVTHELTLRGFRGSSHVDRLGEAQRELGGWLRSGEAALRGDGRGGARASARGARPHARRWHHRQDARADRLMLRPSPARARRSR